ncbi:MAG TPA: VOC family protein [Pseudomonadota bacterium]|jgi:predicted enzyme related to lactoylglutathione lyase|nr:VOC family protein [Pseudomonadota bacterium]HNG00106.1 VOC family protein [Pseudomonadota bacterium]
MFCWYELRTTDVSAAQRFYAAVMQWETRDPPGPGLFWQADRAVADVSPLSLQARQNGAPAHWLGHLSTGDLDRTMGNLIAAGALLRGPVRTGQDGSLAVLRDPHGAMVGLSTDRTKQSQAVSWHELHVLDAEKALALYCEQFGWQPQEVLDLPMGIGPYRMFASQAGKTPCGAVASMAHRPQVHTHWLFYFAVDDLDAACARVVAQGGEVFFGPVEAFGGRRIAVCHDPQGAEFALQASAPIPC